MPVIGPVLLVTLKPEGQGWGVRVAYHLISLVTHLPRYRRQQPPTLLPVTPTLPFSPSYNCCLSSSSSSSYSTPWPAPPRQVSAEASDKNSINGGQDTPGDGRWGRWPPPWGPVRVRRAASSTSWMIPACTWRQLCDNVKTGYTCGWHNSLY